MAEVWIYLDESGTADFDTQASPFFAFGSATITGDHAPLISAYLTARASRNEIENGFHAYNDSLGSKDALYGGMKGLEADYAATFMLKAGAYGYVKSRPKIWLYKYTLYLHLKAVIPKVSEAGDDVHVVAAHISMDAKRDAVRHAVEDVCEQMSNDRRVTPHIWKSPTSAGLQIADYALWAIQRQVVQGKHFHHYGAVVEPRQVFLHFPWGR